MAQLATTVYSNNYFGVANKGTIKRATIRYTLRVRMVT